MIAATEKMNKRQIFLIEDEPIIAGLLCHTVFDLGYEYVGPAYDLQSALLIARNPHNKIDAALVDIMLGKELSYELCHALHDRDIPFAFATGMEPEEIEAPWRKCHYVKKPFTRKDIAAALEKLLRPECQDPANYPSVITSNGL